MALGTHAEDEPVSKMIKEKKVGRKVKIKEIKKNKIK